MQHTRAGSNPSANLFSNISHPNKHCRAAAADAAAADAAAADAAAADAAAADAAAA